MANLVILKTDGSYTHVETEFDRENAIKNLSSMLREKDLRNNKMVVIKGKDFDVIIDLDKVVQIKVED